MLAVCGGQLEALVFVSLEVVIITPNWRREWAAVMEGLLAR